MKSSSSGIFVAVCLFAGLFVVPLNCQGAPTDSNNSTVVKDDTTPEVTLKPNIATTLAPPDSTLIPDTNTTTPNPNPTPVTTPNPNPTPVTTPAPVTTSTPEPTTPSTTVPDTNTTTTASPNTTTPSTTSSSTTTTTKAPDTTTTSTTTSTTPSTNTTTTAAPDTTTTSKPPLPPPCRRFDGPSFIGGIVLTLGLLAIGLVAYKFYKAHTGRNYHTL